MLIGVGNIGIYLPEVQEIDLNPVILSGEKPVVVDALIVLKAQD
jgi:acetyl-CoA synthetase (ADP-forming)